MTGPRQPQPPPPPPPHQHKSSPHHLPPAVMSFLAGHPLNMELISRPEGKQLLMGLESGNINIDHLVQQLNNPALQVTNRKFSSNCQNYEVGMNSRLYLLLFLVVRVDIKRLQLRTPVKGNDILIFWKCIKSSNLLD